MESANFLLEWTQASRMSPEEIGGKAFHLAQLASYGFAVPNGIVIPASICRELIDQSTWQRAIEAANAATPHQEAQLAQARETIVQSCLPQDFIDQLHRQLDSRGWQETHLAIRSSAPGEDSRQASFAGIHHSVLNVTGIHSIEKAILEVLASLWTPQACVYRQHIGLEHTDANMAIIVMPMVAAEMAGVIFTIHPHSGREDQLLISSVHGLADALVNGSVAGEDISIQRNWNNSEWQVISRRPSHTEGEILSNQLATQLAQLAIEVANALDYTQAKFDIEWVYDGTQFVLVQARPITAHNLNNYAEIASQGLIWTRGNSKEILPFAVTMSEVGVMQTAVNEMLSLPHRIVGRTLLPGAQRIGFFHGHAYLNASLIQWEIYDGFDIPPETTNLIIGGHQSCIDVPRRTKRQQISVWSNLLKALIRFPALRRRGLQEVNLTQTQSKLWRQQNLDTLSNQDLLKEIMWRAQTTYSGHHGLCTMQGASGSLLELRKRLLQHFPQQGEAITAAIMSGGETSVSAQQGYDLMALAKLAVEDQAARDFLTGEINSKELDKKSAFAVAYHNFLDQYGHRGNYESYLSRPSWREDPRDLHQAILSLHQTNPTALRERQQRQSAQAWETIKQHCNLGQRLLIHILHKQAKLECDQRELARSCFALMLERARQIFLELGKRLQLQGALMEREDIFHLSTQELEKVVQGKIAMGAIQRRILDRKIRVASWNDAEQSSPPDLIHESPRGQSRTIETSAALSVEGKMKGETWAGIAVSVGSYQGRVRLIRQPSQIEKLQDGDIMLAPHTDPSWLPLFLKASAVIVETGGYLSHSAIVARELGIPTVVNLPGIMNLLQDDDLVYVDGNEGTVTRLEK